MIDNFKYWMPSNIIYGKNSFAGIDNHLNKRRVLVVTSSGFIKRGLIDKLESISNNIVEIISNVKSHPEFIDLKKIYNRIRNMNYDVILAIGGGSVIDTAKFLSVSNKTKDYKFVEDITKGKIEKNGYILTPIIAVPTTAGTGSEITPWATIWDMQEKKKYSLHLKELFSEVALYDSSLTLSVPKDITIQTGLDTLSHALESVWNKNANEITLNYAIKSSKLVLKYLPLLVNDLENEFHRDKLMKACMYSALAFSNTQTALAHAMSYYITAYKGVAHGIACSFTLPLLIDNIIGKYEYIDKALIDIFGELSSKRLRILLKDLNISTEFSDYNLNKQDMGELKKSLKNNIRSNNSLVNL